jgi:hypothetical protein
MKEWRRMAGLQDQPTIQDVMADREEAFQRAIFADTLKEYNSVSTRETTRRYEAAASAKVLKWLIWL